MAYEAFDPYKNDTDFEEVVVKYHGNITLVAKHYNVFRSTVYDYFKRDPNAKKIVDKVRGFSDQYQIDWAEKVIMDNMLNWQNNPALAQRAAEKVIDKKGHLRGWKEVESDHKPPHDDQIDNENEEMSEKALLRKQLAELQAKIDHLTQTRPELSGIDPQV